MTDILLWAEAHSDMLATLGGAGAVGTFLRWAIPRAVDAGIAWRKVKRDMEEAAKKAAEAKAAADEVWRAQVVNGLQNASAAVEAMQKQMVVFTATLKDHDERTRETSKVVARVDGFLDRLERAEHHAFEAKMAAASAERAVAALTEETARTRP